MYDAELTNRIDIPRASISWFIQTLEIKRCNLAKPGQRLVVTQMHYE